MDHAALRQLTAGAVLDDLDPAEREALDRHLASCPECRLLTRQLDDVLGDLALLAPEIAPPPALLGQVLTAMREPTRIHLAASGAAALSSGRSGRIAAPPSFGAEPASVVRSPRLAVLGSVALAAALGVVAVGLGARTVQLTDDLAEARAAVVAAESRVAARDAVMAVVADPGHVTALLHAEPLAPTADPVVVFRPGTEDAYLMATDLPPTPPGQVYQLWYADAAGVHALGTFHHDGSGAFVAPFEVDLAASTAAMVTLEPEGGAQGDPGPQVIFGEL